MYAHAHTSPHKGQYRNTHCLSHEHITSKPRSLHTLTRSHGAHTPWYVPCTFLRTCQHTHAHAHARTHTHTNAKTQMHARAHENARTHCDSSHQPPQIPCTPSHALSCSNTNTHACTDERAHPDSFLATLQACNCSCKNRTRSSVAEVFDPPQPQATEKTFTSAQRAASCGLGASARASFGGLVGSEEHGGQITCRCMVRQHWLPSVRFL